MELVFIYIHDAITPWKI